MKALELSRGRFDAAPAEYVPVIVIGGGQAGLSVGYHLARSGVPFLILDANAHIGFLARPLGLAAAVHAGAV